MVHIVEEVVIMKRLLSDLCGVTDIDQPSVKLSTPKNRSIIMSVHKIRKDTNEGYQLQIHAAVLVDLCQILVAAEQYFMVIRAFSKFSFFIRLTCYIQV